MTDLEKANATIRRLLEILREEGLDEISIPAGVKAPAAHRWMPYPATPPAPGWYYHLDRKGNISAWHLHVCREDGYMFKPGQTVWGCWDCALSCTFEAAASFVRSICRIPDPPDTLTAENQ